MMRGAMLMLCATAMLIPLLSFAQNETTKQQYAGQERREIKSLSPDEIQALLEGHGMGLAKAAELNHYPGPRHVLELAVPLALNERQRAETQKAFESMRREAVELGKSIVEKERELDHLFATGAIDSGKLKTVTQEIAALHGSLRAAHLRAHLEMRRILSPEQIKKYDELRGYKRDGAPEAHPDKPHHGKH